MSKETDEQKRAFQFLSEKFCTQKTFNKEEFRHATGWEPVTFNTYWSKQFKTLLRKDQTDSYRVSEVFRRFITWEKFQTHVTQNRSVATDYTTLSYENVILFEFFMPLTNEGYLRTVLDSLFYKDSIISRIKTISKKKLHSRFERIKNENNKDYFERICQWLSNRFSGYSISHVSGRFRADELKSMHDVYKNNQERSRYIIDETTAIVRFIFPCGQKEPNQFLSSSNYFEELAFGTESENAEEEADLIRWFFFNLFVQSVVEVVNGEDEIWMLESGMKNKLYIWRVQK